MLTAGVAVIPPPPARIHIVGIGGIGLSGLAQILHSQGYAVTGSDANSSDQTAALMAVGIPVVIGHTDRAQCLGEARRCPLTDFAI